MATGRASVNGTRFGVAMSLVVPSLRGAGGVNGVRSMVYSTYSIDSIPPAFRGERSKGHRVRGGRSLRTPPLIRVEEEREDALTHRWVPGAMMTTGLLRQSVWPIKRI